MSLLHISELSATWYLYLANRLLAILTFGSLSVQPESSYIEPCDVHSVDSSPSKTSEPSPTLTFVTPSEGKANECRVSFADVIHLLTNAFGLIALSPLASS